MQLFKTKPWYNTKVNLFLYTFGGNMKDYYKINEISKLYGISADSYDTTKK